MTEEKLVERVTALFADSDAAQRKMIRLQDDPPVCRNQ